MLRNRLLTGAASLVFILVIAFLLIQLAPGDPVSRMLNVQTGDESETGESGNPAELRRDWMHKLGLDLPPFYISIAPMPEPDTIWRITNRSERNQLKEMLRWCGNWQAVVEYHRHVRQLKTELIKWKPPFDSLNKGALTESEEKEWLVKSAHSGNWKTQAGQFKASVERNADMLKRQNLLPTLNGIIASFSAMENSRKSNEHLWMYVPSIHLHGNNRFHRWLFGDGMFSRGILRGDLGISYLTRQPVAGILKSKMKWSVGLTIFSVLLAYLFSIPAGLFTARQPGSRTDRNFRKLSILIVSLPLFWLATLLLMVFANPDFIQLVPASGVGPPGGFAPNISFFDKVNLTVPYLVLPTICYTIGAFAFLSRAIHESALHELRSDYVRTARTKGLTESRIVYVHILRNQLPALLAVFSHVFPASISGSVLLETIFSIPGMGLTLQQSIASQDYPVISAVFLISAVVTLLSFILSDLLTAWSDPRTRTSLSPAEG